MNEAIPTGEKPSLEVKELAAGQSSRRHQVFVSHAHADRDLAKSLTTLLEHAFSGMVVPYFSSDPSPGGGIQPGNEWYAKIHKELLASEAVWVLATVTSIARPWLYWEAGIGRAVCPRGIVVVRVKVKPEDVPSPLNAYQSFDATRIDDTGVLELLEKIGNQVDMTVQRAWLEECAKKFVELASRHEPVEGGEVEDAKVTPEVVGRLEALVSRMEGATSQLDRVRLGPAPSLREPDASDQASRASRARVARRAEGRQRVELFGEDASMHYDLARFLSAVAAHPNVDYTPQYVDSDRDIVVIAEGDGRSAQVYLRCTPDQLRAQTPTGNPRSDAFAEKALELLAEADAMDTANEVSST